MMFKLQSVQLGLNVSVVLRLAPIRLSDQCLFPFLYALGQSRLAILLQLVEFAPHLAILL